MVFHRIPVHILAANPAEKLAFADILGAGAGALGLAENDEMPMVALVCPSGDLGDINGLPAVILGSRREDLVNTVTLPIPADLMDVLAALESIVQHVSDPNTPRRYQDWLLDPARLLLRTAKEQTISLTDTEARILICLFDAESQEVTRDTLLQRVWGYRPGLDTHTVETHIYRLRQKIETDPTNPAVLLTTEAGYRLA